MAGQNQRVWTSPTRQQHAVSLRMTSAVFGEAGFLLVDFSSSSFLFISAINTSFAIELTFDQMLSDSSSCPNFAGTRGRHRTRSSAHSLLEKAA